MKRSQTLIFRYYLTIFLSIVYSNISAQEITYLNEYKFPIKDTKVYEPAYYSLISIDDDKIIVKTYSMDSVLRSEKHTLNLQLDPSLSHMQIKEQVLFLAEYNEDGNLSHYQKMIGPNKIFDQRFYANKKIKYQRVLLNDEIIEESYYDEDGTPRDRIVEKDAEPQGGVQGWHTFLSKNLKYPKQATERREEGVAWLYFKLDEKGKMSDLSLMNPEDISPILAKEALRVFKIYPYKWVPATYDGKPVSTEMKLPLRFKI